MPIQPPARQGSSVHKTLAALRDCERSKLDLIEAGEGNRRRLENLLSQLHVAGHVQKRTVYSLTETGLAMLEKIDAWRPRKRSESRKTRTKAAFLPGVELGDAPAFIAPDPDAVRSLAQALAGWRVG